MKAIGDQFGLALVGGFRGRVLAVAALAVCLSGSTALYAQDRAAPIPPPPADRSLLPVPLEGVVMVRVENGRLNVPLGGWGGQRLIHFPIKDSSPAGSNWAQCRHHYFSSGNSSTADRARKEAEWQLASSNNANSAAAAIARFGCGFFMTEGGCDDKPKNDQEEAARIAGIQRMVELCKQRGYGWCLWAHGDWANGFDTIGAKIKTTVSYPSITGTGRSKRGRG